MAFSAKVYHQPGNDLMDLPDHILLHLEEKYGFNRADPDDIPYAMREGSILIVENEGKVIFSRSDGGEPEDQSFGRNWAWVAGMIERAYNLGRSK